MAPKGNHGASRGILPRDVNVKNEGCCWDGLKNLKAAQRWKKFLPRLVLPPDESEQDRSKETPVRET